MGRQLIVMGMGMGIMTDRQGRFSLRVMCCVRIWVIHGTVLFPLIIALLILAGM
jgi:hypothetical protein